jgi:hypothetical protein
VLDPTADNGPILSAITNRPVTAPGGLYPLRTPVRLRGDGTEWDFQGIMPHVRTGRVTKPENSAVVLWYSGNALWQKTDEDFKPILDANGNPVMEPAPAIFSTVHGGVFQGVNLWRRPYQAVGQPRPNPPWNGIGWCFANPASSYALRDGPVAGFDIGIWHKESTHTEHNSIENYRVHDCRVFFRNDENQSVSHSFRNIYQHGHNEVMFQYGRTSTNNGGGGAITYDTICYQWYGTILDIEKSNPNSCQHRFTNLRIDPDANEPNDPNKRWKLVRQRNGPLSLYVRGIIGNNAAPHKDAIKVKDDSDLDVQMWWKGKIWPRDYFWDGTEWKVRL